jgi:hypothetical protein
VIDARQNDIHAQRISRRHVAFQQRGVVQYVCPVHRQSYFGAILHSIFGFRNKPGFYSMSRLRTNIPPVAPTGVVFCIRLHTKARGRAKQSFYGCSARRVIWRFEPCLGNSGRPSLCLAKIPSGSIVFCFL